MPLSEADARKAHMESIGRLFLRAQRDFQTRMVKKLQSELQAEREYSRALEAHVKTLQESD